MTVLAGIDYTTYPDFALGPLTIRTFGTLVGIGVVIGAYFAARQLEQWGITREETYRMATRMVLWGVIGSRVTWVLSHLDEIENPIDLIALWEGGIQFSGGFIAAIIVGLPTFMKWNPLTRWRSLDGYAYGLIIGLAIGRIGCYSVGEHFGKATDFALGTTYLGGGTQEPIPVMGSPAGAFPCEEGASELCVSENSVDAIGATFHNTSLYEFMHLSVLFAFLTWLLWVRRGKGLAPGTIVGIFTLWYGLGRFATDLVRVADTRVLGLTGAQYTSLAMAAFGIYVLVKRRHQVAELETADQPIPVEAE